MPSFSDWIASSIRRKAIVGLLVILLSAVFLIGLSIVGQARDFILAQVQRSSGSVTHFVANGLVSSAGSVADTDAMTDLLELVCTDPAIRYAAVMAADGRLLASGKPVSEGGQRLSLPLAQLYELDSGQSRNRIIDDTLEMYRKLGLRDGSTVFLLLSFDISEVKSIVSKITRLIAVNAFLVYIIGLLVLIAAVNRLTRPLENLTEGLRDVGGGRTPSPVAVQGKDEVAALTVAFNTMIQDLKRTEEEVGRYQRHLQDMVKDRTVALNLANEHLLEANRSLQGANEKLMELDKLKSNFLGIATHELKTPLAVVGGYLESLGEGFFGSMNESQESVVQEALSSCNRMGALISDMLDLNRIESGRMPMNVKRQPLIGVVSKVAGQMIPLVQKKRLTLDIQEEGLQTEAVFDEDRILQVLVNLVSNAVKFTPEEGTISVSAKAAGDSKNPSIEISVTDTGIGIEPSDLEHIFEEFAQVGPVGKEEGTGLGLAICKRIVDAHGGRIWAESATGEGSRFTFALPVNSS